MRSGQLEETAKALHDVLQQIEKLKQIKIEQSQQYATALETAANEKEHAIAEMEKLKQQAFVDNHNHLLAIRAQLKESKEQAERGKQLEHNIGKRHQRITNIGILVNDLKNKVAEQAGEHPVLIKKAREALAQALQQKKENIAVKQEEIKKVKAEATRVLKDVISKELDVQQLQKEADEVEKVLARRLQLLKETAKPVSGFHQNHFFTGGAGAQSVPGSFYAKRT